MTAEAPIRIDLSQDSSWDQVKDELLTQDEKSLLKEHFTQEHEGIIYLTKQEIEELKVTIAATEDPRGEVGGAQVLGESFKEFIEEQKNEGLSSSDIIGGNELFSEEDMNALDGISQGILFGDEGVFKGMNISKVAQDNISVALTLSLIDQITNKADITPEHIKDLLSPEGNLIDELESTLDGLSQVVSGFVNMEDDPDANYLDIAANGERNFLFMQTEKGKEFFDEIFSGELKSENIEARIESQNIDENITLPGGIENDVKQLGITGRESISQLQGKLEALAAQIAGNNVTVPAPSTLPHTAPNQTRTPEARSEKTGLMRFLENLFKMLGIEKLFEGVIQSSDIDSPDTENDETETQITPENIEKGRELFRTKISEGNISPFTSTQIQELFPEEGELSESAKSIIKTIYEIGENKDDETFQKEFDNLFGEREGLDDTKFEAFIIASNNTIIEEGKAPGENILAVLSKYKEYRAGGTGELFTTFFASDTSE